MQKRRTTFNLDAILDTALGGVGQTAVFMGLGLNAISDPNFTNYSLTHVTMIQLVPPDVGPAGVAEFKRNFATWVVACGLRELVETSAVFLDQICRVCLHIALCKGDVEPDAAAKLHKTFARKGIEGKFCELW